MSIRLIYKLSLLISIIAVATLAVPASAQIPVANKPVMAVTRLVKQWQGFPAVLVHTATMDLYFRNGNTVKCFNWNPAQLNPTPWSVGRRIKGCKVSRGRPSGKPLNYFRKGSTIDVAFGNIGAVSSNWIDSSSGRISGSNLRMTRNGRIAIGKFRTSTISSRGNDVARSRLRSIKGRYYLDGHTITIRANNGEVFHGFIGAQSNRGSKWIDHIYINGVHFWNRRR